MVQLPECFGPLLFVPSEPSVCSFDPTPGNTVSGTVSNGKFHCATGLCIPPAMSGQF